MKEQSICHNQESGLHTAPPYLFRMLH